MTLIFFGRIAFVSHYIAIRSSGLFNINSLAKLHVRGTIDGNAPSRSRFTGLSNEVELHRLLLTEYEKSVRPVGRHDFSLTVTFSLALTQIIDVVKKKILCPFVLPIIS